MTSRSATTATGPTVANSVMAIAAPDCTDTMASSVAATPASTPVRWSAADRMRGTLATCAASNVAYRCGAVSVASGGVPPRTSRARSTSAFTSAANRMLTAFSQSHVSVTITPASDPQVLL